MIDYKKYLYYLIERVIFNVLFFLFERRGIIMIILVIGRIYLIENFGIVDGLGVCFIVFI